MNHPTVQGPTRRDAAGLFAGPRHLRRRVTRLKAHLQRLRDAVGIDALLVGNPVDIRYLTGFVGDDSWLLVPAGVGPLHVISDRRFEEQIEREAPHAEAVMRENRFAPCLKDTLKRLDYHKIGYQKAHTTVAALDQMAEEVDRDRLVGVDDGLIQQRQVKDAAEVDIIRAALRIQQEAFTAMRAQIRPGMSEFEVAAVLEFEMRRRGADGTSFPTIVAAEPNSSLPHAIPGSTKLEAGRSVLVDWGARYQGYCSDLTRVLCLGEMPAKIHEIYEIVLEAQQRAIAAIAPGRTGLEIDAVARDHITEAGFGEQFGHSLGHGLGLDIHEQPRLSKHAENVTLEPGHVVTVEPGIYLPDVGGVRIEDDVLVTETGHEVLSDLPKSLESAVMD